MIARVVAPLAVAVSLLAVPSLAHSATPFSPGNGSGHDLAVGSDGSAHLAWLSEGGDEAVRYCRVPAGGSACDLTQTLDFTGASSDALGQVQVFAPEVNAVVIYAGCTQCTGASEQTVRWVSGTNGVSFAPEGAVGEMRLGGEGHYLGSLNILGVNGGQFQAMASAIDPLVLGSGAYVYSPSAVRAAPSEAVHVVNNLSTVKYRVYSGALTPASLNVIGGWSADMFLSAPEPDNEETHLSSRADRALLTYKSAFSVSDVRIGLRQYNATTNTFGAPTYLPRVPGIDTNALDYPHHSQDPGNRIHVVWRTLHDGGRLRYSRSDDGGASFSAPANLAMRETFLDPVVDAGPAGTGFAAWRTTGSAIRVVPIDPQPEPTAPPGGGSGPGPGPGPDTAPPSSTGLRPADSTLLPGQRTSFSFSSSEAGLAVLTFQKRVKGLKLRRRGRTRCLPQTKKRLRVLRRSLVRQGLSGRKLARALRKRACRPWRRIGEIRQAVVAGQNTIVFNGRIAGRRLTPGIYRGLLVITDQAGNVSRTERVSFRVVAKRKGRR
jgi:hypothetical protein